VFLVRSLNKLLWNVLVILYKLYPALNFFQFFPNRFVQNRPLKGLSYEIDFENVDENGQIFALIRAAAGF